MALVRRAEPAADAAPGADRRGAPRDLAGLLTTLEQPDADARRWAALDLAGRSEAVQALADRLGREPAAPVREAIVLALVESGGEAAARALSVHLRSDEAAVRNAAVEGLTRLEATAELMPDLLIDPDVDVRVLSVMVLASLRDPRVPGWLLELVERDADANVCGCAVDVLAEVGDQSMREALEALPLRFPDDGFLPFAVATAVERLLDVQP